MGTYDAGWHAYEQVMKKDPAWQKLSKEERRIQYGQYSLGLQHDEIKAANKLKGKKIAALEQRIRSAKTQDDIRAIFDDVTEYGTPKQQQAVSDLWDKFIEKDAEYRAMKDQRWAKLGYNQGQKSGVVEMERRAALKLQENAQHALREKELAATFSEGNMHKHNISKILKQPFNRSAEAIDKRLGIGVQNELLEGMNDRYRFLEERSDYKRSIGKILKKPFDRSAGAINQRLGIDVPNPELDAMNEYYRALEKGDDIIKPVKKFDWKKFGKWGLIAVASAAVLTGLGFLIANAIKKNKEENTVAETTTPVVGGTTGKDENASGTNPVVGGTNGEDENALGTNPVVGGATGKDENALGTTPVVGGATGKDENALGTNPVVGGATGKDENALGTNPVVGGATGKDENAQKQDNEVKDPLKPLDSQTIKIDGKNYKVQKGDNVWNIAKKYLRQELGREPKLSEIKAKEQEIMKKNNLHFEKDGYLCLIYPEQKLDIAS